MVPSYTPEQAFYQIVQDPDAGIQADPQEILRAWQLICEPGTVHELRALDTDKGTVRGYFNDLYALANAAVRCTNQIVKFSNGARRAGLAAKGVYITINPVLPDLLARCANDIKLYAPRGESTVDEQIVKRRWLPVDLDFERPSGISATDEEHEAALVKAREIRAYLKTRGWSSMLADSGNGGHVLCRIDLPNDDASRDLLKQVLKALNHAFGTDQIKVDETLFNAARILKLYGTVARKGSDIPERPHRATCVLEIDEPLEVIPQEELEKLVGELGPGGFNGKPNTETSSTANSTSTDGEGNGWLNNFIALHNIAVRAIDAYNGGWRYLLEHCPWEATHSSNGTSDVAIIVSAKSAYSYKCQHKHCVDKHWADFRRYYEPDYEKSGSKSEKSAAGSLDWPDPEPLPGGLPAVPRFDARLLPIKLRPWICDIAERAQAPLDFPATTVIGLLSSALGRRAGIYPKQYDSWLVVPNLWGIIVGPPGYLKSPMMREALKHLQQLERIARTKYEEEFKTWKIQKEAFESAGKKGLSEDEVRTRLAQIENDKPIPVRYIANDATIEKLGELLKANSDGLLLIRDELSGFLATLDRQGHEADRAFYCEAWNGYGTYTYDRIGRGSLTVEDLCLSVFGGITPGPLGKYLRETFSGERDDGLIQRFQLAVYPDPSPTWKNIDRAPNVDAETQAQHVFERFISYGLPTDKTDKTGQNEGGKEGSVSFVRRGLRNILRFDPPAQKFFNRWRTQLERRIKPPTDEHPIMLAHLGKYRSLMPSLALIFHLCDASPDTPVTLDAAKRAAAWCEYLEAHARRIYYNITSRVEAATRFLGEKIQRGKLPDPFTARDVYRPQWTGLGDPEDVIKALEWLEDINWIRSEVKPSADSGGRPSVRYHVNPKVRDLT